MLGAIIQCHVQWDLLFPNVGYLGLGSTPFRSCLRTGTKDGGFFQRELKSTEDDGMNGVRFENCHDGDTIARPIACSFAVDGEVDAFLMDRT